MSRNVNLYLEDMLAAMRKIFKYVKGQTFDSFGKDAKTIDAVVRNLEIIGEAANNIPIEFKKQNREIPWAQIVGMRNKVIHEYFGVDLEILWQTIQADLPELESQIERLF